MNINTVGSSPFQISFNRGGPRNQTPFSPSGGAGAFSGDTFGMSPEARAANQAQGGAQQLTMALSQGIGQVMQAQMSGDQNASQQAIQGLGATYQRGQQSGQLQQVPPMVRQTAEALLGIGGQNQQGQQAGGAGGAGEGSGGCSGGGSCGGGGAAPESGAPPDQTQSFDEEMLKRLEELLGNEKSEEARGDSRRSENETRSSSNGRSEEAGSGAGGESGETRRGDAAKPPRETKPASPKPSGGRRGGGSSTQK